MYPKNRGRVQKKYTKKKKSGFLILVLVYFFKKAFTM